MRGLVMVACLSATGAFGGSYTNHAEIAVVGVPVAIMGKAVILSNAAEQVTVPLSIFPERERRRLVADFVRLHPEQGTDRLLVPRDIRRAVEANASEIRRSQNRAAKGLCTQEESADFCAKASAALNGYLDRQESSGRLIPAERRILQGGAPAPDGSAF